MIDLETRFAPLIDEGARHREPVAAIETRAKELRSRQRHRQRTQYGFAASFVAVALIAATVGVVHARGGDGTRGSGPFVTTAPSTTDQTPTVPPGWVSYDYGLARLSVPPDYTALRGNGCGAPDSPILEMQTSGDTENTDPVCGHDPAVILSPIDETAGEKPPGIAGSVNGIDYVAVPSHCANQPVPPSTDPLAPVCEPSYWVPALNVVVFFEFTQSERVADIQAIFDTLTYSTYARYVQQPFGAAPSSWQSVAFGGYTVRVPAGWHVVDLDQNNGFCTADANTVYLGVNESPGCFGTLGPIPPPRDSLQLSTVPTDRSDSPSTVPGSTILHHNGLTFVQNPVSAEPATELGFVVEGGPKPVQVLLGLGSDPAVARGILGSLTMP